VSKAIDKAAGAEGKYGAPKTAAHAGWVKRGRMRGDAGHEGFQRPWMKDSEAVDRNACQYAPATPDAERWDGYGTALKPAWEPVLLVRKPLDGTVAANAVEHGTGGLNIDECRVETDDSFGGGRKGTSGFAANYEHDGWKPGSERGRWPANVIHDGSPDVTQHMPVSTDGVAVKRNGVGQAKWRHEQRSARRHARFRNASARDR